VPTEAEVFEALRKVADPELGMNIVDLGLVYRIEVGALGRVAIDFTLTYPGCPAVDDLVYDIVEEVGRLKGASVVLPRVVWDPPWDPSRMSEEARLELGYPI